MKKNRERDERKTRSSLSTKKGEITYGKEKLQICRYPVTH